MSVSRTAGRAETGRLRMPVAALGAATAQDALARQLRTTADHPDEHLLPDRRILPIDAPHELAGIVRHLAGHG